MWLLELAALPGLDPQPLQALPTTTFTSWFKAGLLVTWPREEVEMLLADGGILSCQGQWEQRAKGYTVRSL